MTWLFLLNLIVLIFGLVKGQSTEKASPNSNSSMAEDIVSKLSLKFFKLAVV